MFVVNASWESRIYEWYEYISNRKDMCGDVCKYLVWNIWEWKLNIIIFGSLKWIFCRLIWSIYFWLVCNLIYLFLFCLFVVRVEMESLLCFLIKLFYEFLIFMLIFIIGKRDKKFYVWMKKKNNKGIISGKCSE